MKKEKLNYKGWRELSMSERAAARHMLKKHQNNITNHWACKYGFNGGGELISIIDYSVLAKIF